ncbi:hypothetical protein C4556_01990 [Candidatus Parcubacteria bacterium]|nr:MAG: hypothetical protein C4556_01990 [Candidatus Parcubacteria bacterium]
MTLEKALRWVALGGVFALPFVVFIVAESLYFPFITGKNFAFRIIVEVMTGAWLALAVMNPAYRPRRSWLLAAFALFLVIIAAADLFGVNPFKSFWSNYERMDGWVTLAHLFAYFVVASTMLSEKLWRALLQTSLAVSAVVGLYALLQLFGIASLNPGFSSTARLDATFGNPIYLAAYMLFHVFFAAFLLAGVWRRERSRSLSPLVYFYIGVLILDTLILFLTSTRGAILGLLGGAILAALLYVFSFDASLKTRRIVVGAVILVMLFGVIVRFSRETTWVESISFLQRLASISLEDSTTKARIMNWGMAWEGVKERPILGWGQENYAIVFSKYYNPNMYGQEQWFDRVHNVIFDWLVAGGLLGLAAYLSIFAIALRYLWRKGEETAAAFTPAEKCLLTGLLVAYFFHNLFVFDNVMSYITFTTVLALIASRFGTATNAKRLFANVVVPARTFPGVAFAAVVLVWGVAWFVNANALSANRALLQSLAPHPEGILKNLESFEKAILYNSYGTQEAREQLLQAAVQVSQIEQVDIETKRKFLETAAQQMTLQSKVSPLDPRFPFFLSFLLNSYGVYDAAATVLEQAHALSPAKQTILFEMAANAFARGDNDRGLELYKQAFELAPAYVEARILYASAAIQMGRDALADELILPIIATDRILDARITSSYISRNRYDKLISILEAHIEARPEHTQARFTLAAAYHAAGNSAKAIAVLQEAIRVDPSIEVEANALIQDIRNGTSQ